jgi:hypothetical protein
MNFIDDRHEEYAGWVVKRAHLHGLVLRPVLDGDGDPTPHFELATHTGFTVVIIVPSPPHDWEPDDTPPGGVSSDGHRQ